MIPRLRPLLALSVLAVATLGAADPAGAPILVGTARVDITPELPIRLSGYGARTTEADRAETRLYARALAIGSDAQKPAVLITVELIGIGDPTSEAVAAALQARHGLERARIAICATHVHSGPALADVLPFMFSQDLPAEQQERIVRYTERLRTTLIELAGQALAARRPARLAWSEGRADFAAQRRVLADGRWKGFGVTPGGAVDHALPVLRVVDEAGQIRAVFASYACHCTTIDGGDNFVHHDWAGDAARRVEAAHDGAVALVALGCGADANPNPRGAIHVSRHGEQVAREVERLLAGPMRPLGAVTAANFRRISLALDRAVTREELETRLKPGARATVTYPARKYLAELAAGRPLPAAVPYPLSTWVFGDDLAMVFLSGEVVAEYSLRLRRELDGRRLWVNAYSHSVPCYIPSQAMYAEGGYEVDGSMDYYGWPTRLAVGTEDTVIGAVHALVPGGFRTPNRP